MRLGYALILHKNPQQFARLVRAIYHPDDYYALHVDRKASADVRQAAIDLAAAHSNIRLAPSISVTWGGWGLAGSTLLGFDTLLDMGPWDFAFNLSGQDYPVKSRNELVAYLTPRRTQSFVEIKELPDREKVRMDRLIYYHVETRRRVYRIPIRRRLPFAPYWGSNWIVLNREFAQFCARDASTARLRRFFRHTLLGEENIFQMIAMGSRFRSTVQPHNLHYIFWDRDEYGHELEHPKTLTAADLPQVFSADHCFFARKFDDPKLLDELDRHRALHSENS